MRRVQKTIGLAADSDATVLILGETGNRQRTCGPRAARARLAQEESFVAVNCAAIPADLLESELFGHVKGSFTGATADRAGAFREAAEGTLFLDEIGDMPPAMQGKILRAIESGSSLRWAASHASSTLVWSRRRTAIYRVSWRGAFREDLYYRLNVVPIVLPPLRERREDILPLAEQFLRREATARRARSALRCGRDGSFRTFLAGKRARTTQRHRASLRTGTRRNHRGDGPRPRAGCKANSIARRACE